MLPSGGGIRVLRQFCNQLQSRFELSVHRPCGGSDIPGITTVEYPFPLWKKPRGILKPGAPIFLVLRLLSFKALCLKAATEINGSADAVLVHNTMPIAAPPILQYLKIPSAYFCYEHPRHLYERDIIRRTDNIIADSALLPLRALERRIDRLSAASADKIIALSSYMQSMIREIYHRYSDIVRPGVDTDFFYDDHTPEENIVLSIGALWPFKGHMTAIKILAEIPREKRPSLCIIGDRILPGHDQQLMETAGALGVDILIKRCITDSELRNLYRKARVVVCCQRREPYGLVPLESMGCMTPVLAIAEGGFTDNVFHGQNGLLFGGNSNEGGEILANLLSDSKMSEKLANNGRIFVEKERNLSAGTIELGDILESL